jgi:hypothetical protein
MKKRFRKNAPFCEIFKFPAKLLVLMIVETVEPDVLMWMTVCDCVDVLMTVCVMTVVVLMTVCVMTVIVLMTVCVMAVVVLMTVCVCVMSV